jgi:transglutaminase-like putative cysteine protease
VSAAGHISALRGTAPALRRAEPDAGARKPHVLRPSGPLLPLAFARGVTFVALATFGALHWMSMLEPSAPGRAWNAVGASILAIAALLAAARLRGPARWLTVAATSLIAIMLAFLAGGVSAELLRPGNWDVLASGIQRGISDLPGARVPYRGIDPWIRLVIPLGGTVLTVVAALTAFWPRRAATGFPIAALVMLVTLYAVPAVALDFDGEFLRGALLALLVLGFLRLERLRLNEAGAAALLAVGTVVAALIVAPAIDGDSPWWDYESWALDTASSRSTAFSWNHDYGPLDWPRDGREMLRVKAKQPAYWKAESLDVFDGDRWVQSESGTREATRFELPSNRAVLDRFTQTIKVNVRNLRSRTFITAGIPTIPPSMPNHAAIPNGPPGIYLSSRTLRRGDTYTAQVYTPKPTDKELKAAGAYYDRDFDDYLTIDVLDKSLEPYPGAPPGPVPLEVHFAEWASRGVPPDVVRRSFSSGAPIERLPPQKTLAQSNFKRTWALSQRLRENASDPVDYVNAVESYLGGDEFTYTEVPPAKARTLEGFLFDAKTGYCQQYSGAMALLLRMQGIPARVATGFTSGSYDRRSKEYVVRDLDAHSWVEAWFPDYGWVTYDPTPSAAPPRSQSGDRAAGLPGDVPDLGGGGTLDPRAGRAATEGTPWEKYIGGGILVALLLAGGVFAFLRRGRHPGPLPELERALQRTRRGPGPGATLQALEASFARSPDAQGYVRALRDQRYSGRGEAPTGAQRRSLRTELGRGGGLRGRLRAWWALPPRRSRGGPTLDAHG